MRLPFNGAERPIMPLHPAWLKNMSRRVLWGAFEKDVTKNDREMMLNYFEGRCAYCGDELGKKWHTDHLVPVDGGGFNHISNRVPSCPRCNETEKRETAWLEFLTYKCGFDTAMLEERKKKISDWQSHNLPKSPPVTEAQRLAWKKEVDDLAVAIDGAWNRLRTLRNV